MTVDFGKIEAGDKVQLEFTVVKSRHDDSLCFQVSNHPMADQFVLFGSRVRNFEIVGHTPAPWEPKYGDKIKLRGSSERAKWIITCIDPDGDWIVKHLTTGYKSVVGKKGFFQFELDNS